MIAVFGICYLNRPNLCGSGAGMRRRGMEEADMESVWTEDGEIRKRPVLPGDMEAPAIGAGAGRNSQGILPEAGPHASGF